MISVDKNVEKLESFLITGGIVKWYISKFLQKVKHRVTIRLRNFTPRHIPKKIENPSTSLFTDVHISIIYNSQRVKEKKKDPHVQQLMNVRYLHNGIYNHKME